jgi:thiamine biosynthesis lipoprotein
MGSTVEVVVGAADPEPLAAAALDQVARLERCWSRFVPGSELIRLNAAAGRSVTVSPALLLAVESAAALYAETGGAFDPTVGARLAALGYDRTFAEVAASSPVAVAPPEGRAPGMAGVAVDRGRRTVTVPAGVTLDLGGLGKGLAADLICRRLLRLGASAVCVAVGGDVAAAGDAPGGGWSIPVEDPFGDGVLFHHRLTAGAIVASTIRFRSWERAGRRLHHLIDPRTGDPADGLHTVVVAAAPTAGDVQAAAEPQQTIAARAEALAKAALVLGPEDGVALLRRAGVEAWLFEPAGALHRVEPSGAGLRGAEPGGGSHLECG